MMLLAHPRGLSVTSIATRLAARGLLSPAASQAQEEAIKVSSPRMVLVRFEVARMQWLRSRVLWSIYWECKLHRPGFCAVSTWLVSPGMV